MRLLLLMVGVLAVVISSSIGVGLWQSRLTHDAMQDRTERTLQMMRDRIAELRADTGPTSASLHRVADYLENAFFRSIDTPISKADKQVYLNRYFPADTPVVAKAPSVSRTAVAEAVIVGKENYLPAMGTGSR